MQVLVHHGGEATLEGVRENMFPEGAFPGRFPDHRHRFRTIEHRAQRPRDSPGPVQQENPGLDIVNAHESR